jgi:hypothetical protein
MSEPVRIGLRLLGLVMLVVGIASIKGPMTIDLSGRG